MKTKVVNVEKIEKEKVLVLQIINGTSAEKSSAFNELYKFYKPLIFHKMNLGVFFDTELAKDLTMDVFVKIHLKLGGYKPELSSFSTWIFTIANNILIDYKRSLKYEVLKIDDLINYKDESSYSFQIEDKSLNNNGFDVILSKERSRIVTFAMNSIKNDTIREIIRQRFFDDVSYEEISTSLNLPLGTVKAYVNRGKEEMKKIIYKNIQEFVF